MKRLFVLILLVLVASYWVTDKIAEDAGYLLLSYKNTTVETSLWVALVLLVMMVVVVYFSVWLITKLLGSPTAVRDWSQGVRYKRSRTKTTRGLIDLIEGNWKVAQKNLLRAAPQSESPLINYLAAARAAAANGDQSGSEELLKKAHDSAPEAELAIGITKAEMQMQQGLYEQALASLLNLKQTNPHHKHVHQLLQQAYLALEDWEALTDLMPSLRKLKVQPDERLDGIEHKAVLKLLERVAADQQAGQSDADRANSLRLVWDKVPAKIRRLENVSLTYAHRMMNLGQSAWAEQALREAIDEQWSDELVAEYGLVEGEDAGRQLSVAEKWIKKHPESAQLMLTLGRLSLRNSLWGKAREYFMASIEQKKTPEAYAELGRLLRHLGEQEASREHAEHSFELVAQALPALPMPDEQHTFIAQSGTVNQG